MRLGTGRPGLNLKKAFNTEITEDAERIGTYPKKQVNDSGGTRRRKDYELHGGEGESEGGS
jgi:hypothetical protein